MSQAGVTVPGMDDQLILATAEAAAPALRALAREILEAEARHLGVSLDAADILLRRADGAPAVHITAAADQLLEHLAAIEGTTLGPPSRARHRRGPRACRGAPAHEWDRAGVPLRRERHPDSA